MFLEELDLNDVTHLLKFCQQGWLLGVDYTVLLTLIFVILLSYIPCIQ